MRCFNHPAVDAIGTCKHCSRGLCKDCIAEVHGLVACKGRCEHDVEEGYKLLMRSRAMHAKTAMLMRRNAVFYLLFGAILLSSGGVAGNSAFATVMYALGVLFVLMGGWSFILAKKYASDPPAAGAH